MLQSQVSPPVAGTSRAYSSDARGGFSRYDMSVCQTASPAPRLPIGLPSSPSTFDTT